MSEMTSLNGQKFNSWTVIGDPQVDKNNRKRSLCRCVCGKEKLVDHYHLRANRSRSCRKCSAIKANKKSLTKHGMSKSKVYRAWQSMKTRCYNTKQTKTYRYYGAIGIKVCDEWLNSFDAFYAYVGDPPTRYHSIDRIDPWGHYEPGNVKWSTEHEQRLNQRRVAQQICPPKVQKLFGKHSSCSYKILG